MPSKYDPLRRYLSALTTPTWHASFADVEHIVGFPLPVSARLYPAWWANSQDNIPQHRAWLDAGWRTSGLNLAGGFVFFERTIVHRPSQPHATLLFSGDDAQEAMAHSWDAAPRILELRISMTWQSLGCVLRDSNDRLRFPSTVHSPAIYCFRVRHDRQERRYIGETDNLARRFQNYRTPGATQATNVRINAIFLEVLRRGAEISASAVTEGAWVDCGSGPRAADLQTQSLRRLLEHAAIVDCDAQDIEVLNRTRETAADSPLG